MQQFAEPLFILSVVGMPEFQKLLDDARLNNRKYSLPPGVVRVRDRRQSVIQLEHIDRGDAFKKDSEKVHFRYTSATRVKLQCLT